MTTTAARRRQVRSMHRRKSRMHAEDGSWTVIVAESPHEPSSYVLNVQTPTRNLMLSRSESEILELYHQLCDAYPGVPRPAFPIRSSALSQQAQQQTPATQHPILRLPSPGDSSGSRSSSQSSESLAISSAAHGQGPVEVSPSENTTNVALAWYLTTLSNDPFFRHVPPWNNFVRVRTTDLESTSVEDAIRTGEDIWDYAIPDETNPKSQRKVSLEDGQSVNIYKYHTREERSNWAAHQESDLPEVQVSDFEMVCVLGIGSKGKVLLASQKTSSNMYALKVMTKRRVLALQEMQRTLAELAVLRRMADEGMNPSVVKLWRSFHDEDYLYLVMDFHPGGDLRTQIERWGNLSNDCSRFYAAELVDGIEGLHAAGVIHRNLKPEHILIDREGHIVICGFGKSKELRRSEAQPTTTGIPSAGIAPDWIGRSEGLSISPQPESTGAETTNTLCGTAEYFAPEVIKGLPYSYEIDWWSFGTILYEMLTGIRPFDADNMSTMYDRILQDELLFPEDAVIHPHTQDFIRQLLERDPALRLCEPQIKLHTYFSMVSWPDLHDRQYKPPDIPLMDASNPCDTQNFEKAFLDMKPVIGDEIGEDKVQELEQTHTVFAHGTVGNWERYTPNNQLSIAVNSVEGSHAVDEEDRESGSETPPNMPVDLEGNAVKQTILEAGLAALWKSSPLTQRTLESSEHPDNPIQAPENFTLPTASVADAAAAAFARRNLGATPKSTNRLQPNVKRTRRDEIHAPEPDLCLSDTDDESVDEIHGEKRDNCPQALASCDGESTNGPCSPKTMSKRSFSTLASTSGC